MDKKIEILLGSEKNINSVNTDSYDKVELTNQTSEIMEFNINDVVDSTQVFDNERQNNAIYRIYGRIEWMSILNGVKNSSHNNLIDYFNPQYTGNSKNLLNSFDFYLVAPSSSDIYNSFAGSNGTKLRRSFTVLADSSKFELYPAGFTNNVYGEQVYAFNFKIDFDVTNLYDKLGFPITELFLYAQYKKYGTEVLKYTTWSTTTGVQSKKTLTTKDLNIGDDVEIYGGSNIHDVIEYVEEDYYQASLESQTFYIRSPYYESSTLKWLEWNYNPFIPIQLRYLSDDLDSARANELIIATLDVTPNNISNQQFNATKSIRQTITENQTTINNWDDQISSYFTWNSITGILKFKYNNTYKINFKTEVYLTLDSDKYIIETSIEEVTDPYWETVPNTTIQYYPTSLENGINYTKSYNAGDELRVIVRLKPNPDERKVKIIPDYAKLLTSEGRYVWREINPQGYIEPLTGVGVNYPFFNKRRYLFSPIILDVLPNLTTNSTLKDPNTINVFNEMSFSKNATSVEDTPTKDDLNNLDKPCQ